MHKRHLLGYLRNAEGGGGPGGGGAPPPAAPPPAALPAFDVDKLVGALVGALETRFGARLPPAADPPPPSGKDATDPEAMRGRIAQLERSLADQAKATQAASAAALERDRIAQIRTMLSSHAFASDSAAADALRAFGDELQFDKDGQLVGRDGRKARDYVDAVLREQRPYLLKPLDAGGAGARGGGAAPKAVDLDSIRVGMSAEDRAAVLSQIRALTGN